MRRLIFLSILVVLASALSARADLTDLAVFKTVAQDQTGPSTFSPSSYFYDGRLFFAAPGEFTTGNVTGAVTGPLFTLAPADPTTLASGGISVADQASLDASIPADTYTVSASGGTFGPSSFTATIAPGNAFPLTMAAFTPSTFAALQGLDASQAITLNLLPFLPSQSANESDIFLNIINTATSQIVFSQGFLPATTTSIAVAAGTLSPGTSYRFDLVYSDRINTSLGDGHFLVQGFDNRTGGAFATRSVPEPASFTIVGLGAACLAGWSRRTRARRSA